MLFVGQNLTSSSPRFNDEFVHARSRSPASHTAANIKSVLSKYAMLSQTNLFLHANYWHRFPVGTIGGKRNTFWRRRGLSGLPRAGMWVWRRGREEVRVIREVRGWFQGCGVELDPPSSSRVHAGECSDGTAHFLPVSPLTDDVSSGRRKAHFYAQILAKLKGH